jgi:signal transduction histidine kinase
MALGRAAAGPFGLFSRAASKAAAAATRNVRATVIFSLVLICGSFACAAAIQLRLDRGRALDQATQFETRRAQEIAADLGNTLDRYAALGAAFANATGTAETSAALSEAGGRALRNIVILDRNGEAVSQMKGAPQGLLPLGPAVLAAARAGRTAVPSRGGDGMAILFPLAGRIVAVQVDLAALLHPASMEEAVLATEGGRILDLGARWTSAPSMDALGLVDGHAATRFVEADDERRLVALRKVPDWPVVAGASMRVGEALSAWYKSLPLFVFFILGPALAGGGLAVVFVREFERRTRAADAVKALRNTPRDDAKLLIRLADAERRAAEAERSKSEFVAHMSHELRTPLNAIIGFSDVIAEGMFGDPGHIKYVEYAKDISTAGRHLHAQIGDILDFASLEAGRHPISRAEVDVSQIARSVVDELAGRAFSRRIRITVSLAQNARALTDMLAIRRILTNLLSNAIRFTPDGGTVRVEVRNEDGAVVASIRDTGLGFTSEELKSAGRPFARFDRPGAPGGIGMGLATAIAIARRIGGALRLTGTAGEGTVAQLSLPKA